MTTDTNTPMDLDGADTAASTAPPPEKAEVPPSQAVSGRTSWKGIREHHPLFVLGGSIVVAAGVVAGVMQYFHTQHLRDLQAQHQASIRETVGPIKANVANLQQTNARLVTELGSVRRTVGGESMLFDVRNLFVSQNKIKSISSELEYFADQRIYAGTPATPPWSKSTISELELISKIQGSDFAKQVEARLWQLPIREKNIAFWQSPDAIRVKLRSNVDAFTAMMLGFTPPETMTLFPFVAAQRFDRALLAKSMKVIASEEQDEDVELGTTFTTDRLDGMERMFASDLAGVMMTVQAQMILGVAQTYKDAVFSIENTQKRGPVLYMNARVEFQNAQVVGRHGKHTVRWDREIIVAALGDTAYLIMTSIPTVDDGRSPAYSAVQQWLNNLRIPAELAAG